ncbi:putative holin-like toxin [Bacillus sp. M6-12]|nr:putative holin-like toxin [Bacillus sp. M6-12]
MTVFETLMICFTFASLIVAMLSFNQKNNPPLSMDASGWIIPLLG